MSQDIEQLYAERMKRYTTAMRNAKPDRNEIRVSLNREDSFEKVFSAYKRLMVNPSMTSDAKEKWINSLKSKMISANLVDAQISITREEGRLKIRVKK